MHNGSIDIAAIMMLDVSLGIACPGTHGARSKFQFHKGKFVAFQVHDEQPEAAFNPSPFLPIYTSGMADEDARSSAWSGTRACQAIAEIHPSVA
jgi:hypothetical protein